MGKYTTLTEDLYEIIDRVPYKVFPENFYKELEGDKEFINLTVIPDSSGVNMMSVSGICILDIYTPAGEGPRRYAEIADHLGLGGKSDKEKVDNLIKAIEELKEKIGIKKFIKEYDVNEKAFLDTLDEMVEQAFDDQCTGANPRYPLMEEIKNMYLNAYYGGER